MEALLHTSALEIGLGTPRDPVNEGIDSFVTISVQQVQANLDLVTLLGWAKTVTKSR